MYATDGLERQHAWLVWTKPARYVHSMCRGVFYAFMVRRAYYAGLSGVKLTVAPTLVPLCAVL